MDDAPIIQFVNKILIEAIKLGASDIHFEPYDQQYRIRMRLDGILREHSAPSLALGTRVATRLKIMAQLDIAERRLPQDGHLQIEIAPKTLVDLRVSSCPTVYGEKLALRILDPTNAQIGIDNLGLEPAQKEIFLRHVAKGQGMILTTGPTGSGKTVTLYTAINLLNSPAINITAVEDPVEINVQGINQVNVNLKAGLDFATALRAFLRQDPDVIMVGEIRDLETAQIAIKAAQTGHLVLSTLHTNTAADTLVRLVGMGIPAYHVAASVSLIIAQRLVRILCPHCKQQCSLSKSALLEIGFAAEEIANNLEIFTARGCQHCHAGYKGRTGIYEIMEISNTMAQMILEGCHALDLAQQAQREGTMPLHAAGLAKVRQGITSVAEIIKVTD